MRMGRRAERRKVKGVENFMVNSKGGDGEMGNDRSHGIIYHRRGRKMSRESG